MTLDNDQRNAAAQMLTHITALPPAKRAAVLVIVQQLSLAERSARPASASTTTPEDSRG